jgi:hypothetical protein
VVVQPCVEGGARHVVRAQEIDVDHRLESVRRNVRHRRGKVAGCIVDDDIEAPVVVHDVGDDLLHGGRVAHVAHADVHVDAFSAQLLGGGLEAFLVAAGDRDSRAVRAEHAADLLADATAATRDERDLA